MIFKRSTHTYAEPRLSDCIHGERVIYLCTNGDRLQTNSYVGVEDIT